MQKKKKKGDCNREEKVHHVALNWEYYFGHKINKYLFSSGIQSVCSYTTSKISGQYNKDYSRKVQMGNSKDCCEWRCKEV